MALPWLTQGDSESQATAHFKTRELAKRKSQLDETVCDPGPGQGQGRGCGVGTGSEPVWPCCERTQRMLSPEDQELASLGAIHQ